MQIRILCLLALAPLLLTAQKVTVFVQDQDGNPVEDAAVKVTYEGIGTLGKTHEVERKTDENGFFHASGNAKIAVWFWAKKDGYYDHGYYPAERDVIGMNDLTGEIEKNIELRQVINPTALYGTFEGGGQIPLLGEWCGYDFAEGDWVAPHGDGTVADMMLRFNREFIHFEERRSPIEVRRKAIERKYGRLGKEFTEEAFKLEAGLWDISLEVAFPGKKEGLVRVTDGFNLQSILRMPHQAPEEGYEAAYGYQIKSNEYLSRPQDIGFFLRTRVILDEDGEIESANYAKIHEDFRITVEGKVSFTYYFNPVPNDRNLEFDPKQNLFPEGAPGTFNFVLP